MIWRIDKFFIRKFQAAYLWLYDLTGVYVGTLTLLISVATIGSYLLDGRRKLEWIDWFFLTFQAFIAWLQYNRQAKERIDEFNEIAELAIKSVGRFVLLISVFIFLIPEILTYNYSAIIAEMFWFALSYLYTIKIRKREPREHREFAGQGAGR